MLFVDHVSPVPETPVPPTSCSPNEYRCTTGPCISLLLVCDGRNDCVDGGDEAQCDKPTSMLNRFNMLHNVFIMLHIAFRMPISTFNVLDNAFSMQ